MTLVTQLPSLSFLLYLQWHLVLAYFLLGTLKIVLIFPCSFSSTGVLVFQRRDLEQNIGIERLYWAASEFCSENWNHALIWGIRPCILKHLPLVRKLWWHLGASSGVLPSPHWARRDLDASFGPGPGLLWGWWMSSCSGQLLVCPASWVTLLCKDSTKAELRILIGPFQCLICLFFW